MGISRAIGGALRTLAGLALLPLLAAAAEAGAAASPWASTEAGQVRLISASAAAGQAQELDIGLHVRLEPGWKVYWRSPGDAGLPPRFDWSGSRNLADAEVRWPAPKRFTLFGLHTFGYGDEVVLPVVVRPARPGEALSLRLDLDIAMCKDICILHESAHALELPAGAARATVYRRLIDDYRARVPALGTSPELSMDSVRVTGPASAQVLEVRARAARAFAAPELIIEGPPGFYFAPPEVRLDDGGLGALLRVVVATGKQPRTLAGEPITLTLIDGKRGLERRVETVRAD